MLHFHLVTRIAAALAAVAIAGCSGGGGSTSGPLPQTGALAVGAAQRSASSIALAPSAVTYKSLYSFTSVPDGANPVAGLIDVNGTLYGTTLWGGTACPLYGAQGCGTVFSIPATGGSETVLYRFQDNGSDGASSYAGLIDVNGKLYGTTFQGGASYAGTVFTITTSGAESVLHSFTNVPDGANPLAGLIDVNGTLYGTTLYGGTGSACTSNCGTVFSIPATGGSETVLHSFQGGSDGATPLAGLLDVNGTLYSTTEQGGASNDGTVFKITTSGTEGVLYSFKGGSDGANPVAGLIDVNGALYGTTSFGGASNDGTVFKITTSGKESVLYSFKGGSDGAYPDAGLIFVNGKLYGTTYQGGASNDGTVFKITMSGTESVLHSFTGTPDGAHPAAGLIDVNGTLYGTTQQGGVNNCSNYIGCGTVFSISL